MTDTVINFNNFRTVTSIALLRLLGCVAGDNFLTTSYWGDNDFTSAARYAYDASDTTTADNGGSCIVTAAGQRIKLILSDGIVSAKAFGAKGDNVTVNTTVFNNCLAFCRATLRNMFLPVGQYITGKLNVADFRVGIIGESTMGTILQAPAGFTDTLISMLNTTTNGGDTFEQICNLTVQGVYGAGSVGLDRAMCSRSSTRNVRIQRFDTGERAINSFTMYSENVEINDCRVGLQLSGSNHDSVFVRCSYIGAGASFGGSGTSVLILNGGADGQQSVLDFYGCDFEFTGTAATGIVATMTGVLTLHGSYGEQVGDAIITMNQGRCEIDGGRYIIHDATGFFCNPAGAGSSIYVSANAEITSDGSTRTYPSLIKTGGSGVVVFERSTVFTELLTSNVGTLPNNLGSSPLTAPFLTPQGTAFSVTNFTGVGAIADTGDTRKITATTAGTISVNQAFSKKPFLGVNSPLVIQYASTQALQVTFAGAVGQSGTLTAIGNLPNTGGVTMIAVFPQATLSAASQNVIEFWSPGWALNSYLQIQRLWLCDGGAYANGQLSLG